MSNVIEIKFHTDLGSSLLNRMRARMEYAEWRRKYEKAKAEKNYEALDRLDRDYEYIGLP